MIRAFLALELPEAARDMLAGWQAAQEKRRKGPRFTDKERLHVTLRFFGNLRQAQVDEVQRVVTELSLPREVATRVVGFGGFPSARKATVLVAKLEDQQAQVLSLSNTLTEKLLPLGFEAEARAFVPHVTLARMHKAGDITAYAKNPSRLSPFSLSMLTLFHSELHDSGSRHFKICSWPLAARATS
jgi:2'-5' RNA ligase